ncbi:MAG: DUF1036 domain-containing protein, partial [Enterobacterales bacterium]|nr:DUF1036 domain-containing protein [Enterobacterales bacterium]
VRLAYANDLKQIEIDIKCYKRVWFALRYKDYNGNWVTDGFYDTNKDRRLTRTITSDYYYYYAVSDDRRNSWSGDAGYYTLYGENYGFRKRNLNDESFKNTLSLTCN